METSQIWIKSANVLDLLLSFLYIILLTHLLCHPFSGHFLFLDRKPSYRRGFGTGAEELLVPCSRFPRISHSDPFLRDMLPLTLGSIE